MNLNISDKETTLVLTIVEVGSGYMNKMFTSLISDICHSKRVLVDV